MSTKDDELAGPLAEYALYIMRHGLAAARDVASVVDDAKRPLTSEGKQKMREISAGLVQTGAEIDWIVSSPLVRAVETAEIVAEELGSKPPLDICEALKPAALRKR